VPDAQRAAPEVMRGREAREARASVVRHIDPIVCIAGENCRHTKVWESVGETRTITGSSSAGNPGRAPRSGRHFADLTSDHVNVSKSKEERRLSARWTDPRRSRRATPTGQSSLRVPNSWRVVRTENGPAEIALTESVNGRGSRRRLAEAAHERHPARVERRGRAMARAIGSPRFRSDGSEPFMRLLPGGRRLPRPFTLSVRAISAAHFPYGRLRHELARRRTIGPLVLPFDCAVDPSTSQTVLRSSLRLRHVHMVARQVGEWRPDLGSPSWIPGAGRPGYRSESRPRLPDLYVGNFTGDGKRWESMCRTTEARAFSRLAASPSLPARLAAHPARKRTLFVSTFDGLVFRSIMADRPFDRSVR